MDGGTVTIYVGGLYEKNLTSGEETRYYFANGRRIAMRKGAQVYYLLADHLGSTTRTLDTNSSLVSNTSYYPFGSSRSSTGASPTDRLFTGQQLLDSTGLYNYGARFYDPALGRFISADPLAQPRVNDAASFIPLTVSYADPAMAGKLGEWNRRGGKLPSAFDPQLLNRYSYSRNNPTTMYDPSGNFAWMIAGAVAGAGFYAVTHWDQVSQGNINYAEAGLYVLGGATLGASAALGVTVVGVVASSGAATATVGAIETSAAGKAASFGEAAGRLTIVAGGNYSQSELRSAQALAQRGLEVVLRPAAGMRSPAGMTSDLLVNGRTYDVYTPVTSNANAIISAIARKGSQAYGVVVDLSQSDVNIADLGNVLQRVQGAGSRLQDVIILSGK